MSEAGRLALSRIELDDGPWSTMPASLDGRVACVGDKPVREDGRWVVCWLHHAVRGRDNPVLDAAVLLGNHLGVGVLVYQGLGGRHRYNSDRHHRFILEGAADACRDIRARGLAYAFHLPMDPSTPSPLGGLLERACALVTEDYPAPPFPEWTSTVARRAPCATFVVDGACVMPVRFLGKRHTRAFKFQDAAKDAWAQAMAMASTGVPAAIAPAVEPLVLDTDILGFEAFDLHAADFDEAIARCEIDHSVPPVGRIRGGSDAGYERWWAFRDDGLKAYDRRRNDAADMDAVSCLSPYLHHGHVSAWRLACEARAVGGSGAEKFLDELLVWREMAFYFCAHAKPGELDSLRAIPEWARETLEAHATDPRDRRLSWEALARAQSGDPLWDEAQRSLLVNGELHNNIRMTWGKAVLGWTGGPDEALRKIIDLNHRYALDGSDPNSYGGLLWCLGQFDRPFEPAQSITGTVRGRSPEVHAERLPPDRYRAAVLKRVGHEPLRVAVVGGGVTGLACARVLADQLCSVTVFDKGRTPGGRLSSRVVDLGSDRVGFDFGCPGFTVTDARLGRYVRSWMEDGACGRWSPTGDAGEGPWVVGLPHSVAIAEHLARGLDVRPSTGVTGLARDGAAWVVSFDHAGDGPGGEKRFDAVVLAAAPEQCGRLLCDDAPEIASRLREVRSETQWVLMLALSDPLDGLEDVAVSRVGGRDGIDRCIREDTKPGRRVPSGMSTLVVHASAGWSTQRYETDRDDLAAELTPMSLAWLGDRLGREVPGESVVWSRAHRWGLSRAGGSIGEGALFDRSLRVAVAGEGVGGLGVEAAFLSGHAAAGRLLSTRQLRSGATGTLFDGAGA